MLKDYTIVVFGSPRNMKLEEEEVVEILRYLREGGAIVLANSAGGDQNNNTNLNSIATHLGFQFNGDYMAHETDFENDDFYDTVCRGVSMDPLTMGVRSVHTGYACTLKIIDPSGCKSLVFSHEPWPESRVIAANGYYALGRYFATSLPVFKYLKHHDNSFLLQSILYWLSELRGRDSLF
jgi:hypothetical protein